jgi:hypothetical protein
MEALHMLSRTTRTAALVLALTATAASPVSVATARTSSTTSRALAAVYSRQDKRMIPAAPVGAAPAAAQPVVRIQAPGGGFDWGDAGIGAAGGLALALLAVGGVLLLTDQRSLRTGNHRRDRGTPSSVTRP